MSCFIDHVECDYDGNSVFKHLHCHDKISFKGGRVDNKYDDICAVI